MLLLQIPPATHSHHHSATIAAGSTDLTLSKSTSPIVTTVRPGGFLNYLVTVINSGPNDATNVRIVDDVPTSLLPVLDSLSFSYPFGVINCTLAGNRVACLVPLLRLGDSCAFVLRVTVRTDVTGDTISNTASCTSDSPELRPETNTGAHLPRTHICALVVVCVASPSLRARTDTWVITIDRGTSTTTSTITSTTTATGSTGITTSTPADTRANVAIRKNGPAVMLTGLSKGNAWRHTAPVPLTHSHAASTLSRHN